MSDIALSSVSIIKNNSIRFFTGNCIANKTNGGFVVHDASIILTDLAVTIPVELLHVTSRLL